jgi:undecaprenyl diphosphate synthase
VARYVAIITDGSGRWAHKRGLSMAAGHDAAANTLKARVADAVELGIEELSVYTFSTENWSRPADEVRALMDMFTRRIAIEAPELDEAGVKMRFLGRREGLPEELLDVIDQAQTLTQSNHKMTLFIAFNYGGKAEILDAARRFAGSTEEEFRRCLYDPQMHDPELVIRTSGEQRLSNYLLWQSAYSELVFREELWPDFTRESFEQSLSEFTTRKRRFGGR